jgi:hypothetical protein
MPDAPADPAPSTSPSTDEKVAYVHDRIRAALHGSVEDQWDEVLAQWDGSTAQRDAVRAQVTGLRNRAWQALRDIQSLEELERGLTIQYLELKSRWTMLNVRIQHQTTRQGTADEALTYRATCVSLLVEALEPLLAQDRLDALADLLAQPLQEAADGQL